MQITTKCGAVWIGAVIYQSPASTLVQVGPGQQIRITGDEVQSRQSATISSMPPGLLTGATDQDLADLYAYLKTLE